MKYDVRGRRGRVLLQLVATCLAVGFSGSATGQDDVDLGGVRESHVMIPMRDGQRLSAYLYFPEGDGPWPAVFEQRYAQNGMHARMEQIIAAACKSCG